MTVLEQFGVPAEAIRESTVPTTSTLEELDALAKLIQPGDAPVLLVTSPYHTRRVALAWQMVTGGRSPGIVRAARTERFDATWWWLDPAGRLAVVHEYLGLIAYGLGLRGD
jgi:uncharacterized SAM-binding protein YcdF (DUF218 family)